jgi:hypothetical protein
MAELRIPIIGEFKGKKAFDQAGGATSKLDKGVKKLGATLIAAFSVQKITQFGKAAVNAFVENEKSAKRLETVVKNLGLAFELPGIEASLDKVSAKFGYEGEVLREAFQKLITTTGSAKKSQDLLNLSLDIAAGSGVDLLTVNQDLAAAYVGQTRGLRKYNLGLTQSELKTLDFDSAVSKLTANFKGAGGAELQTYAGKMRVLQEAAGNAQEIIGEGLVSALQILAGDGNTVQPLADSMTDLATATSDVVVGLADIFSGLKNLGGLGNIKGKGGVPLSEALNPNLNMIPIIGPLLEAARRRGAQINTPGMGGYPSSALGPGYVDPNEAARKKAERDAAKRAKELAALQKKTLDTQKKSLALQKASKTLNLEAIGIEAALKGEISETDRLSLLLQKSILQGNATLATQLADQLEAATQRQNQLRALLLTTPEAPNPYRNWALPQELLNYTASSLGVSVAQLQNAPVAPTSTFTDAQMELAAAVSSFQRADQQAINIEVYLDSGVVTNAVSEVQTNNNLSGSFTTVGGRGANTARFT